MKSGDVAVAKSGWYKVERLELMSVGGNAGYAELKLVFFRTLVLVYPCAGTTRTIGKPMVTENR